MVTFKTKKKELIKVFKHFYPGKKKYSDYKKEACEITIINAKATFSARGAQFHIDCITKGTAKLTVPLYYLYNIVESDPSADFEFEVTENEMKINKLIIKVDTCFFQDDSILKTIKLPFQYNDADVIQLLNEHTVEELAFNHIFNKVNLALVKLDQNMRYAYAYLKEYGVKYEEIEKLIGPKLFKDGKIPK